MNNKKLKDLTKSKIKIFGFQFDTKPFWITISIVAGVFVLLLALTLFGVELSWYGVLMGVGFMMALVLAGQLCKERELNPELPYTMIWFVFPCSIIGARLYYMMFNGGIESFSQFIRIWEGGLAIYGGIIGGLLGLIACCLWKKVNIISATDMVAPLLALGQFFGRIGCVCAECCYGVEVTNKALQWFPIALKVNGGYHYATNLYEAVLNFGIFIVLTIILRKIKIKGITTCGYLFGYGLIRFVLESFRAEEQTLLIGKYPVSQLVSIICVLIGVIGICTLLIVNNLKSRNEMEEK